jgi:hypothetical protein
MLILLDSGSSHTFVDFMLASKLSGVSELQRALPVRVANGDTVSCKLQFIQAEWELQGLKFSSDLKVLSLQHFDMVLGYD